VTLVGRRSAMLFVQARRIAAEPVFAGFPQQSDYETVWEVTKSGGRRQPGALGTLIRRLIPRRGKDLYFASRSKWRSRRSLSPFLRRVDLRDSKT
jgi:hypothetical protein